MEIMNEISDLKTGFPPAETSISELKWGKIAYAASSLSAVLCNDVEESPGKGFLFWWGWRVEVPDNSSLLGC